VDDTVLHLEDEMEALVFSPSGNLLAAGGSHGKVRIWEVTGGPAASWPEVAAFGAPSGHLVFSPDGRLLATSSYEETKLWDVATWQELRRIDGIGTTCFSPDGRWLAATTAESGTDKTVLWDVQSGERGRSFDGSVGAFLPGEMLLTTYRQSGVTVWDITSGEEVRFYARMGRYFSPDGQLSASRGQNGQAILFDMETGEEVHVLGKPGTDVLRLAFSPDGALLASTRRMWQTVTLWDVSTGQVARVLRWHWNHIFGIAFSPDGRLLATGAYDGVIKVWDTATW
ncbi:MAG: WD40 repeat domain-containing protein, partial [Anaerolineae bacterium]